MWTLQSVLAFRTHRDLELTARAHGLPFTRRISKAEGLEALSQALHEGTFEQAVTTLTPDDIEALHALVAAGGWMPLLQFTHHFGDIRPYRPWRSDFSPRHPWRYPASVAEKLYQLAMIHIDDDMITIVNDVTALLPSLPVPEPVVSVSDVSDTTGRSTLLRDMAAFLGVLLREHVVPVHDRWLPLSILRQMNDVFSVQESLNEIRSELQTGRLRWLHYLADVAGLVQVQGTCLTPTTAAWEWLQQAPAVQWDLLWQAVRHDLEQYEPRWRDFRLPEIDAAIWTALWQVMDSLDTASSYRVLDLIQAMRPYVPALPRYGIACLVRDVLSWSGVLVMQHGYFYLHRREWQTTQPVAITLRQNVIQIDLPVFPQLPAWTALFACSRPDKIRNRFILDADCIRQAAGQGYTADDVRQILTHLTADVLNPAITTRIEKWFRDATSFTMQRMVVLTATDCDTLNRIRADWRLRPFLHETLSPHHIAVRAEHAATLLQYLHRRRLHPACTGQFEPVQQTVRETPNASMLEYCYLAIRVYQQLDVDVSVRMPGSMRQWLAEHISDPDHIEQLATQVIEQIARPPANPGAVYESVPQHDPHAIQLQVEGAIASGEAISMMYYSPYADETTTRTVEPRALYDSEGLMYMDAFCHQAHAMRTFRLDRIMSLQTQQSVQSLTA